MADKPKDTRYKTYKEDKYSRSGYNYDANIFKIGMDIAIALFTIILISNSVYVNTEYERSLITRFGEIKEVTQPGVHFKLPFIESRHTADTRMEQMTLKGWIATKGGTNRVNVTMIVNHRIDGTPANIKSLYKLFGGGFDYESRFMTGAAIDKLKASVSKHEIASVTDDRDAIRNETFTNIEEAGAKYGIMIKSVQISNIEFDPEYLKKLKQVQAARAQAAAAKEQEIQAKFLANKKIQQARGEAESKKLSASAEAYKIKTESVEQAKAIIRVGNAKAKSIKAQNNAAKNAAGLAELRKADAMMNWKGDVPQFMSSGSGGSSIFPFMDLNKLTHSK